MRKIVAALIALLFWPSLALAGSSVSGPPPGWTQIATSGAIGSGTTTVTLSSIPTTYQDLLVVLNSVSLNATGTLLVNVRTAGVTYGASSGFAAPSNAGPFNGSIFIPLYNLSGGTMFGCVGIAATNPGLNNICGNNGGGNAYTATGGINGIQFTILSGATTFAGGTITLYAR